jgi:hypothetical protein
MNATARDRRRVRHVPAARRHAPLVGLGALAATLLVGCPSAADNPCGGVDCSSRGYCTATYGQPLCACIPGFHPVGLACLPIDATDPCRDVACSGHGECSVVGGAPTCVCAPGYHHPDDYVLHCVEDAPCDAVGGDCGPEGDADVAEPRDDAAEAEDAPEADATDDGFVAYAECTGTCQEGAALDCEPGWTAIKEWHSVGCACECVPRDGGECTEACECSVLPAAGGVWCVEIATESLYYDPPDADPYYWERRDQYVTAAGTPVGESVQCKGAWCSGCDTDFTCGVCCR